MATCVPTASEPPRRVAIIAAQVAELRPLLARLRRPDFDGQGCWLGELGGFEVVLTATGEGRRLSSRGARKVLQQFDVSLLVGMGVAGALSPALDPGQVLVGAELSLETGESLRSERDQVERACFASHAQPAHLLTVDRIVGEPAEREVLWRRLGCPDSAAVDMESYDLVACAQERGVPALIVRAISDSAAETLPSWLNACRRLDGAISRRRVVMRVFREPSQLPGLLRMRARVQECAQHLASAVENLITG